MADYFSLEDMMNTTENMEKLIDNSAQDDNTLTFDGVDWFLFDDTIISNVYISGNSWFGLGKSQEHLLVCRRDAKMYNLYREEATLFGAYRVLKFRWEGYSLHNSTKQDVELVYEWFFIDNGDMFLNLIETPSNENYLGNSKINGSVNQDLTVRSGRPANVSFYHLDDSGRRFDIRYEVLEIHPSHERKYLLSDAEGRYYKTEYEKAFVDAIIFQDWQLIQTGIVPDPDTRVEIRFAASRFDNSTLFAAGEEFGVSLVSFSQIMVRYGANTISIDTQDYTGTDITLELSKEGLKRDGEMIASFTEASFVCEKELLIGASNTGDPNGFEGEIYSIKVWQKEEQLLDLVPCVDENLQSCFYDSLYEKGYYNQGYGFLEFMDDKGAFDAATNLVEIEGVEELTSGIFIEHGFSDLPKGEVLTRLIDPCLLYWQNSDTELPVFSVDIQSVPPPQVIYSKNNEMTDSSVTGIEKVDIEADESSLFAFSFDGGETWKAFIDNMWVDLSEETSGMNYETVNAIGTDAWTIVKETMQYMVRFVIFEGGYVKRVVVHYLNEGGMS